MPAAARLVSFAAVAALAAGCGEPCCTYDSLPIRLQRAPGGALLALVATEDAPEDVRPTVLDTGTPLTLWVDPARASRDVVREDLRLLGAPATEGARAPLRARIRGVSTLKADLAPIGVGDAAARPRALLGGNVLVDFSVEIGFRAPELRLWSRQPTPDGFLAAAGYAVLRAGRFGGGALEVLGPSSGLGPRGPYQYPPSLVVLRACAAPAAFARDAEPPARCCPGEERTLATGVDLSLVLATGVGPTVLGRSAWERLRLAASLPPPTRRAPLHVATARAPIDAEWAAVPRLALVDREAEEERDPGPCVELARARRLEQVAIRQARAWAIGAEAAACALPCDLDSRRAGRAQNSAAYVELGGEIEVAIVADGEPLLQTLRAEVRPEGPEVSGILGAAALGEARVEIDYRGDPARAIFSCEDDAPGERCRAVGRCPRLPNEGQTHLCFGLPAHGLPRMCDNQTTCD